MIHPQLATMLAVLTTDYPLESGEPLEFLRPAVETSFNSISVDGECSTNDAVCLLANGASGIERTPATDTAFALALGRVCGQLAEQIVADGEGATMVAEIEVTRRRGREAGARDRRADRHLAARQDGALRQGRQLGPRPRRRRVGAVQRRLRASRPRPASRSPTTASPSSTAARRRASSRTSRRRGCRIELDLGLGAGERELPDERPLLRLREDQRGLPHVRPVVVKLGGAVASRRPRSCSGLAAAKPVVVVHGAGPQISDEMERRGLDGALRRRPARDDAGRARRSCASRWRR